MPPPAPAPAPLAAPLGEEDVAFFAAFGYLRLPGFLGASERAALDREFAAAFARQYPDRPFDGSRRQWTPMMDEETPFHAGLLEDPRLVGMARQLLGEPLLATICDTNRYVGDTPWHSDSRSPLQRGVKFAFYLDPVGARSGALRVIPGSHLLPLPNDRFADAVARIGAIAGVPAQALESTPGDLIAFDLRLWHASVGGAAGRRMGTVVYYNDPQTDAERGHLLTQAEANIAQVVDFFRPARPWIYSRDWIANPRGSALRAGWIRRLRELGVLDIPGTVEGSR